MCAAVQGVPLTLSVQIDGQTINIVGSQNTATVVEPDIEACNSVLMIVDAVLIPADGAPASG